MQATAAALPCCCREVDARTEEPTHSTTFSPSNLLSEYNKAVHITLLYEALSQLLALTHRSSSTDGHCPHQSQDWDRITALGNAHAAHAE